MSRFQNKLRNLQTRIKPGTLVYHYNGKDDTRCGIYTGNKNNILYNEEVFTLNKFCVNHKKETRPDISSSTNAWKNCYIEQIEDNKGSTLVSEGVDANYLDMLNYAVFALIKLKK